jgi:hypothetical protein
MMVMMMVVVMGPGSERGTCKHHQEQRCCKQFLHKTNPSMQGFADGRARKWYVSRRAMRRMRTCGLSDRRDAPGVHWVYDDAA